VAAPDGGDPWGNLDDAAPSTLRAKPEAGLGLDMDVDMGRWSLREMIEHTRNTGERPSPNEPLILIF
jgi:hypothetical protein